jgi:hypothetical protein
MTSKECFNEAGLDETYAPLQAPKKVGRRSMKRLKGKQVRAAIKQYHRDWSLGLAAENKQLREELAQANGRLKAVKVLNRGTPFWAY